MCVCVCVCVCVCDKQHFILSPQIWRRTGITLKTQSMLESPSMSKYGSHCNAQQCAVMHTITPVQAQFQGIVCLCLGNTLVSLFYCVPPPLSLSLQYLGSTSVTRTHGTGSTDDAVKTIVQDVRELFIISEPSDLHSPPWLSDVPGFQGPLQVYGAPKGLYQ